ETLPSSPTRLWLFLLLSSHRPGKFPGYVRVIDDSTDKAIFFAKLTPSPRFGAEGGFWATRARIRVSSPLPANTASKSGFVKSRAVTCLRARCPFLSRRNVPNEKVSQGHARVDPP